MTCRNNLIVHKLTQGMEMIEQITARAHSLLPVAAGRREGVGDAGRKPIPEEVPKIWRTKPWSCQGESRASVRGHRVSLQRVKLR